MRNSHYKSICNYHIVICPKYRHKILYDEVRFFLKNKLEEICEKYGYNILDMSVEIDHVHLALELQPTYSIGSVIRNLKSISGYYIFRKFENLRNKYFWNSGFWTNGYYVSTVGNISKDKIMEYIKSQENYE